LNRANVLCLLQEILQALLELVTELAGLWGEAVVGRASGNVGWQIFLDGDGFVQIEVKTPIGHAKAAKAQHLLQFVLLQRIASRQGMQRMLRVPH